MSVNPESLTGQGYACTLTFRDIPNSPEEFAKLRNRLFHRLRRMGCIRCHWVVEWTKKLRPHLHLAIYLPGGPLEHQSTLIAHWLDLTKSYGTQVYGQFITQITDQTGWSQYVSKHASRGANHYQRNPLARPENWDRSGRMWGKFGEWDTSETDLQFDQPQGYFQFRRWMKKYRISVHRTDFLKRVNSSTLESETIKTALQRYRMAKKVFKITTENAKRDIARRSLVIDYSESEVSRAKAGLSATRGMSEWIDGDITHSMLEQLAKQGFTSSLIDKSSHDDS